MFYDIKIYSLLFNSILRYRNVEFLLTEIFLKGINKIQAETKYNFMLNHLLKLTIKVCCIDKAITE